MRLLITGGDHTGKDSLARAISTLMPDLGYQTASSRRFADFVPEWQDGRDLDQWWQQRRENRQAWVDAFDRLRHHYRPAVFATKLYDIGERCVVGLRYTSEMIDLLTASNKPDLIVWCRYANRTIQGNDVLTLDLAGQLTSIAQVPLLVSWSDEMAPAIVTILRGITHGLEHTVQKTADSSCGAGGQHASKSQ